MKSILRCVLVVCSFVILPMSSGAATEPAYDCILEVSLLGHWEFDLFDSGKINQGKSVFAYQKVLNPNPNVTDTIVDLTSAKIKATGTSQTFTSDQAKITIEKKAPVKCPFDTANGNKCWRAKLVKLVDVNKDIGKKSVSDLMKAKWICYGK